LKPKACGTIPTIELYNKSCGAKRTLATGYADVKTPGEPQGLKPKALGTEPVIESYDCGCG
jgi:hypothetical protein